MPAAVLAAVVLAVAVWSRGGGGAAGHRDPVVGNDLHALAAINGSLYVNGHGGAGVSGDSGLTWTQIDSLDGKDAMGWAISESDILVGGHAGLFRSTGGASFAAVGGLPVTDIHGLGAVGNVVYVASPQGGIYRSVDGRPGVGASGPRRRHLRHDPRGSNEH